MTLSEFRAWLDGYTARMGDAPTAEEWAAIKAKLAQVSVDWNVGPAVMPRPGTSLPYPSHPSVSTCGGTAFADAVMTN